MVSELSNASGHIKIGSRSLEIASAKRSCCAGGGSPFDSPIELPNQIWTSILDSCTVITSSKLNPHTIDPLCKDTALWLCGSSLALTISTPRIATANEDVSTVAVLLELGKIIVQTLVKNRWNVSQNLLKKRWNREYMLHPVMIG